jgi:acyl carrier protein
MTETAIIARLQQAFAAAWIPLDAGLDRGMVLKEIDGLDSVSRVRLMLSIESAFAIELSPLEHGRLQTVGDLVDLIGAKAGGLTSEASC